MTEHSKNDKRKYNKPELMVFGLLRDVTHAGSGKNPESASDQHCIDAAKRPSPSCK